MVLWLQEIPTNIVVGEVVKPLILILIQKRGFSPTQLGVVGYIKVDAPAEVLHHMCICIWEHVFFDSTYDMCYVRVCVFCVFNVC